jgi:outer membrane immunogenic protein
MRTVFFVSVGVVALLTIPMAARAADMHVKAPPPAPLPPPFSWTGFYIGGNVGGAWRGHGMNDNRFGMDFDNGDNNGVFIAGGQVGGNYQFNNNIVIGVEGDFDWAARNSNSDTVVVVPTVGTFQVTSTNNNRFIATVAGRLGVTYDRWLFYAKGGGGWVGNNDFTITNITTGASINVSNNNTDGGWLAGGGIEWAFASNWSGKIEYDFLGLNGRTFTVQAGPLAGDTFTTHNRDIQMVKFGINYRLGGYSPVMARY